jgi:O-antigen/teichoic acid export membrane protein
LKNTKNDFQKINGNERSKLVKLNLSQSFVYRMISIAISYLVVPLAISYVTFEQYGIWITILSILSWISFFDIGLGNGLRNKLTEALSENRIELAKEYIATAYFSITIIVLLLLVSTFIVIPNLQWNKVFNTQVLNESQFIVLMFIVIEAFLLNFLFSLVNQVFYAVQMASIPSLSQMLASIINFISVLILVNLTKGSLIYYSLSYCGAMVSVNLVLTIVFFKRHNYLKPNLKDIRISKLRDIMGTGIKFFVVQIAYIVIFTTDNMIITQVLGPRYVTEYDIVQKLFKAIILVHGIIVTPLWSAYTDSYIKGDIKWIKNTLKKLNLLMIPIIFGVLFIFFTSDLLIKIWIGKSIELTPYLVLFSAIYAVISIWNNIYAFFLNGINVLNLQMFTSLIGGVLNIPISIYLANNMGMGSSGVILGTVISLSFFAILGPIQTYKIIKDKEKAV